MEVNLRKDEQYVLHLCDQILGSSAHRQYNKFDFLTGDPNKNGTCRRLPVDAYYSELGLVIEYCERQHDEPVKFFDKPDRLTLSGVSRGEQRKLYDQRRRDLLPKNGIKLLEISYRDFDHNRAKRIIRNPQRDLQRVRELINPFIQNFGITQNL